MTSRTWDKDKHAAANDALSYLKTAVKTIGVRGARLDQACKFMPKVQTRDREKSKRAKNKKGRPSLDRIAEDEGEEDGRIRSLYAGKEALWSNAEDFWSVVGWAFNCSVVHKHRWERWKVWLDFMLDVLSSDLGVRAAEGTVEQCMLAHYLRPIGEGRNSKRRLMRAVLADGGQKSIAEFGEIWKTETKLPKTKKEDERHSKKRKLDLENGEFGDYFDNDSDIDSPAATSLPHSRSASAFPPSRASRAPSGDLEDRDNDNPTTSNGKLTGIASFGGVDSINIRKRLLALLVRFCHLSPTTFLDTEDLFDLYTEFLRPLPLPVFQPLVFSASSRQSSWLGPNEQSGLDQMLLRPLLASAAPAYNDNALTQSDFERHYAQYAANTTSASDNAKVGLLVEDLLRLLWKNGDLVYSEKLRKAVEKGIKARTDKVAFDGRRKTGAKAKEDEEAAMLMEGSGERMLACLDMIRVTTYVASV